MGDQWNRQEIPKFYQFAYGILISHKGRKINFSLNETRQPYRKKNQSYMSHRDNSKWIPNFNVTNENTKSIRRKHRRNFDNFQVGKVFLTTNQNLKL